MAARRDHVRWSRMLLGALLVVALAACGTETRSAEDAEGKLPVTPQAINELPPDTQRLDMTIANGAFDSDRYAVQTGAVRLFVTTQGGPYTLTIDPLVTPTTLPANTTTQVDFTAPEARDYLITLTGGGDATATLNVRLAGTR